MKWFKDRGIIIVISIALILALLSTKLIQNPYNPTNSAANYQNNDSSDNHMMTPTIMNSSSNAQVKISTPQLGDKQLNKPKKASLQKFDHIAQIAMAIIAGFGLFIGAIGMWLLWRTLKETKTASDAANKTLDIASNTSKAEFQPYISIGKPIIGPLVTTTNPDNDYTEFSIRVTSKVKNLGKTPAMNVFAIIVAEFNYPTGNRADGWERKSKFVRAEKLVSAYIATGTRETIEIPYCFKVDNDILKSSDTETSDTTIRLQVGYRISFVDNFSKKRRVFFGVFERVNARQKAKTLTYGEGQIEPYDDPQYNKSPAHKLFPHKIYGGTTLAKMDPDKFNAD